MDDRRPKLTDLKTRLKNNEINSWVEMMSTQIQDTISNYLDGIARKDIRYVVSLYANDSTLEDPVGSDVLVGLEQIENFYKSALNGDYTIDQCGPVLVCGSEAVFSFRFDLSVSGAVESLDVIDVMTFDERGRIKTLRAFYDTKKMSDLAERISISA